MPVVPERIRRLRRNTVRPDDACIDNHRQHQSPGEVIPNSIAERVPVVGRLADNAEMVF